MSKSLLPNDERTKIKEIVGKLTCKVLPAMKRLHVRRKTIWKDYVDYRKKKWVNKNSSLTLVFAGEPAVDDGGPRREFFAGMCII